MLLLSAFSKENSDFFFFFFFLEECDSVFEVFTTATRKLRVKFCERKNYSGIVYGLFYFHFRQTSFLHIHGRSLVSFYQNSPCVQSARTSSECKVGSPFTDLLFSNTVSYVASSFSQIDLHFND